MNRCLSTFLGTSSQRLSPKLAIKSIAACALSTALSAVFSLIFSTLAIAQDSREGQTLQVPQNVVGQPGLRSFPPSALRGKLVVLQAPEVSLDGQPARLSPGARIRGPQNELLMSAALSGQELIVNFTREPYGNIKDVWILTPAEQKQKLKTATPERNFIFSSEGNQPKTDDGKTPFNQLPVYKP